MTAIIATLWKPIAALLALIMGGGVLYAKGRSDASKARDLKDATGYQKTTEKANEAPVHTDPAAAREWLRSRNTNQR